MRKPSVRRLERIIESRIFRYVVFSLIYLAIYKLTTFEFAVLTALGQIIGEIHYQGKKE
tara:strand:+ start:3580 stop:3756 length:177 start_codon:yes stop_codon:yes gene_type:complete